MKIFLLFVLGLILLSGITFVTVNTAYALDAHQYGDINWPPIEPIREYGPTSVDCATAGWSDMDQDGICSAWEDGSNPLNISLPDGSETYPYSCDADDFDITDVDPNLDTDGNVDGCLSPNPDIPDIYVEVDFMQGHMIHDPADLQAIFGPVVRAFHENGKQLHIQIDEDIQSHKDQLPLSSAEPANPGFRELKKSFFGNVNELGMLTAKKQVFRYAMVIHSQSANPGSSGWAEIPGNDFIISLGAFSGGVGSIDQQKGTFMHELGHTTRMWHGGTNDNVNCKPNYFSVMNYYYQFSELYFVNTEADYSNRASPTGINQLSESSLTESDGIGTDNYEWWSPGAGQPRLFPYTGLEGNRLNDTADGSGVDWDGNGSVGGSPPVDINNLPGCQSSPSNSQTFRSTNDWILPRNISPRQSSSAFLTGHSDIETKIFNALQESETQARIIFAKLENLFEGIAQYAFADDEMMEEGDMLDPDGNPLPNEAIDEITIDTVVKIRLLHIDAIRDEIKKLPANKFKDSKDKSTLLDMIADVRDLVKETKSGETILFWNAYDNLSEMRALINGGDDDLIINSTDTAHIVKLIDDEKERLALGGTVPEFGPIAALILVVSVVAVIVVSTKTKLRLMPKN